MIFTNGFDLRRISVSAGLHVLRDLGFLSRAANSTWRSESLLILCYHGMSLRDEHKWVPHLYLTPEIFRSRLSCLRDMNASVLPMPEALRRLRSGDLPPRSVSITFDDGFYDFLHHAMPILSEFQYPATLYLTTHYCHHRIPVISLALGYILWKSGQPLLEVPEYGISRPISIVTYEEQQRAVRRILRWTDQNRLDTVGKNEIARKLAKKFGIDFDEILRERLFQILSPEEVSHVARSGINVELHTHRHRTPQQRNLFITEVEENRRQIRAMTGTDPKHFCYPSGDYKPEFFSWLSECGVESAATCDTGLALADCDSMKLPRVLDVNSLAPLRFESIVAGLLV
jgi:peptidoglycan/xylan/chitin deacetylase (PgdA/CDA1 family)